MSHTSESSEMQVDLNLLRKYDRPGPRYTSYPTAPHFNTEIGPQDFIRHLTNPEDGERGLSLYFHIPFCDTLCYFCGCTMVVTHNRARIAEYLQYLIHEIRILAGKVKNRSVRQIHWGGGSPTYLMPDEIKILAEAIQQNYNVAADAEISVEVDPRGISDEHFVALRQSGFNRLSMGVQDFYEPTQKAVNRLQPEKLTRHYIDLARDLGFASINLDFIYGLPYQTPQTFEHTLKKLIDIRPDRIALFNYAHVPWLKKHQRLIDEKTLPGAEQKLQIFKLAIEQLTRAGYVFIGMDHFALPEDELAIALRQKTLYRNFQGYSTHADCDIVAHGISGISQTPYLYAQNTKRFADYYQAISSTHPATERGYQLDQDDVLRREVIMKLMCDFSLDFQAIEDQFQIYFNDYFQQELGQLDQFIFDGLLELDDRHIKVLPPGRLIIRNIAMTFDKYLKKSENVRFSRTI